MEMGRGSALGAGGVDARDPRSWQPLAAWLGGVRCAGHSFGVDGLAWRVRWEEGRRRGALTRAAARGAGGAALSVATYVLVEDQRGSADGQ